MNRVTIRYLAGLFEIVLARWASLLQKALLVLIMLITKKKWACVKYISSISSLILYLSIYFMEIISVKPITWIKKNYVRYSRFQWQPKQRTKCRLCTTWWSVLIRRWARTNRWSIKCPLIEAVFDVGTRRCKYTLFTCILTSWWLHSSTRAKLSSYIARMFPY